MSLTREEKLQLTDKATQIRIDTLKMLEAAGSGHPGGSFSIAEMLTALYFKYMDVDPEHSEDNNRDRFVLSKGHAVPGLYATLSLKGFFDYQELFTLRKMDSMLQGHPDMKKTPGIDMTTGSLGQGLSAANGMALAGKLDDQDYQVFCILGDGEMQEGQIWEAAMTASHYSLDNLTVFLDLNGLQIDGKISDIKDPNPVSDKWRAFGWHVIEIDGHSFDEIDNAIQESKQVTDKPVIIVAKTVKGKGVSFMENEIDWHGKAPNKEQLAEALAELTEGGGN